MVRRLGRTITKRIGRFQGFPDTQRGGYNVGKVWLVLPRSQASKRIVCTTARRIDKLKSPVNQRPGATSAAFSIFRTFRINAGDEKVKELYELVSDR